MGGNVPKPKLRRSRMGENLDTREEREKSEITGICRSTINLEGKEKNKNGGMGGNGKYDQLQSTEKTEALNKKKKL